VFIGDWAISANKAARLACSVCGWSYRTLRIRGGTRTRVVVRGLNTALSPALMPSGERQSFEYRLLIRNAR
jgi:hypothetical protein